ncbi:MAG: zinc ribbon domain-containing protein [Oscillospiraceae bacterium]|jgi:uncharacterized Zn finger protein (UPF0148 family)|nr:zinc ribbon domain-containing protein [Oscillospiraceae bacterium]
MMSLICPNCKKEAEDGAAFCASCGAALAKEEQAGPAAETTPSLQTEAAQTETAAPSDTAAQVETAAPFDMAPQAEAGVQTQTITQTAPAPAAEAEVRFSPENAAPFYMPAKKSSKKTLLIVGGAIALVVVVALAVFIGFYSKAKAERRAYIENLGKIQAMMLSSGSDAEDLANLTRNVWYNTIYDELDVDTYPYTHDSKGKVHSSFNISLGILSRDTEIITQKAGIEAGRQEVTELLALLQDPSKEFAKAYETTDALYDAYLHLTMLAISPSGNYNSYSESVSGAVSEFMAQYDKLKISIPAE